MTDADSTPSGDLVLDLEGRDAAALLEDATWAYGRAVAGADAGPTAEIRISVSARDLEELLVAWLNELIVLLETRGFVAMNAVASATENREDEERWQASGTVSGFILEKGVAPLLIPKAATYHDLKVRRQSGILKARVVVDL